MDPDLDPESGSFFKDKKSKRGHKTVGIKVFLTFLLANTVEGPIPDPDRYL